MRKYVCVLASDNYLDGCLVLNENLKHLNARYGLLCLINEEISSDTRKVLDDFGIEYKELEKVNYDVDYDGFVQPYFKHTFNKLSVFNLTEYSKIVYLDLDLLILENVDDLFDYSGLAMAKDEPFTELYNSGVMVIEPNEDDYKGLISTMKEKMNDQAKIGDQNIINEYFSGKINNLPQSYNLMRRIFGDTTSTELDVWDEEVEVHNVWKWDKDVKDKKILHYIINPKPFQIDHPYDEKYTFLYAYYMSIVNEKKQRV